LFVAVLAAVPLPALAAELPAHDPIRVLVISDEVNPNGLSDAELTQPGDLSAALGDPASGLQLAGPVLEVGSQCIDDALTAFDAGEVDVLVYFAHLDAKACDGSRRQAELTTATERFLEDGGGVVVFHHGIYEAASKGEILELFGARASSIAWDTVAGQDVIAVAPEHFVAAQGLQYGATRAFSGAGIDAGDYPYFTNVPDERYDAISLEVRQGESRTILFASADAAGAGARVLGYDLHRPGWTGHVVFYQPGEYQPNALDDLNGDNFQILANSILYVAETKEAGGSDDTGPADDTAGPADDTAGPADDGPGDTGGPAPTSGPADGSDGADGTADGTGGTANLDAEGSCSCRTSRPWPGAGLLALVLFSVFSAARRRKRTFALRTG
jgi:MYXO-CTERM domain-containing protein